MWVAEESEGEFVGLVFEDFEAPFPKRLHRRKFVYLVSRTKLRNSSASAEIELDNCASQAKRILGGSSRLGCVRST